MEYFIKRLSVAGTILMILAAGVVEMEGRKCEIKGIFNFGDSNSDTGGFWAVFPAAPKPNGMTYFKQPAGRACDGRLIIDFLVHDFLFHMAGWLDGNWNTGCTWNQPANGIGIPFLSPYLKSIGSDFRHGANYATLASTVRLPQTSLFVTGVSPFSLAIQLNQMKEFISRVTDHHHLQSQLPTSRNKESSTGSNPLPTPDIINNSIYTLYIGQNDFTGNLARIGIKGVKKYLPEVVSQITDTIKELYSIGARTFWILNLAPIGCYPAFLVELPHKKSDLDTYGCMVSYNNAVHDYNTMIREALNKTRQDLPDDAMVINVDTHSVLLELFRHPTSHGMKYGTRACCGYGGGKYNFDPRVFCGNRKVVDPGKTTLMAGACEKPQEYVSWDGIHATEAANKIIAEAILNGSIFDPPFPLQRMCNLQSIALQQ